jgi:hypothetical protein
MQEGYTTEFHAGQPAVAEIATDRVERRSEVRVPEDCPARVKVLHPLTSLEPSAPGRVVDRSSQGLGLRVPWSVFPGSLLQIRFLGRIVLGEVRYCLAAGDEFRIGMRLKEEW